MNSKIIIITCLIAGFLFGGVVTPTVKDNFVGSVAISGEYKATSTAASAGLGAFTTSRVINTGNGTLGSLVVTGANTGTINFYNATTTNINLRASSLATSTILLASFPASVAAGTYTLDVNYTTALLVDISGNAPTSTITYR